MEKIEEYIIQKVKEMRVERDWSQQELADYMNISKSFISDIENPRRNAKYNLKHLNTLARVFDVPFSSFFPEKPFEEGE